MSYMMKYKVFSISKTVPFYRQSEPVLTLEPGAEYLYSAKWSPVRPLLFAVGAHDGTLLIYDLRQNRATPTLRLEAGTKKEPVFSVEFSHAQYVQSLSSSVTLSTYNLCRVQSRSVRTISVEFSHAQYVQSLSSSVMLSTYNLCRVQSCSVRTISVEFSHAQYVQSLSSSVMLSTYNLCRVQSCSVRTISVEFSHAQYVQSLSSSVMLSTYNLCRVQSCLVRTISVKFNHAQYIQFLTCCHLC